MKSRRVNTVFASILSVCVLLSFFVAIPVWVFIVLVFVWFMLTAIGSLHIRWNYHLEAVHGRTDETEGRFSLTFDDGPHPVHTMEILDLLDRYQAKATFFCIGHRVEEEPEVVKEIVARGHTIGNHTYSHSRMFGFFGRRRVKEELDRARAVIEETAGIRTMLYRPAFGVTNPSIAEAVHTLGLTAIGWTVRSYDTVSRPRAQVVSRVIRRLKAGDVVLLHDDRPATPAIVEQLLLSSQDKGLRSVTVDRLFESYA